MRNLIFAGVAMAAVCLATPAFAQQERAMGSLSAGIVIGYDEVTLDDGVDSGAQGDVMYGVTAGYDFAISSASFAGVEVEASESQVGVTVTNVLAAGDSFAMSAGRDLYIGARLGFVVGGGTQLYVKGGYSNARIKVKYDDGTMVLSDGENLDGFRVGAGVEVDAGVVALRGEYRYSQYGDLLGSGIDLSRHQLVAGAVSRF